MFPSQSQCEIDSLIVVCCHAIYVGGPSNGKDESEWIIEPFQTGETDTFVEHIREGVRQLLANQDRSVLAFSGGATKRGRLRSLGLDESRTEAEGYYDIAVSNNLFNITQQTKHSFSHSSSSLLNQVFKENYATDSYQNILLSLIQFPIWRAQYLSRSVDGSTSTSTSSTTPHLDSSTRVRPCLPKRLTIISHEFKRARFMELHVPAIGSLLPDSLRVEFEAMEVEYIGINPAFTAEKIAEIEEGDRKRGFGVWQGDLHARGGVLSGKRKERGWDEDEFMHLLKTEYGRDEKTVEGWKKVVEGTRWEER